MLRTMYEKIRPPAFGMAVLVLIGFGSCRHEQAYHRLVRQVDQDTIVQAMNQSTQSPLAIIYPETLDSALQRNIRYQQALLQLDPRQLTSMQNARLDSLHRALTGLAEEWRQYRSDPSLYNFAADVKKVLSEKDITLEKRLAFIGQRLERAEIYYRSAKTNLFAPVPERSRLAAQKHILGLKLLSEELPDSIRRASIPPGTKQRLLDETEKTLLVLKDYLAFCESLWFEHLDSTRLDTRPSEIFD